MRERLPLVLSVTALVIALFGSTPLGNAAGRAIASTVPFASVAGFAKNAGKLNGHVASTRPRAGQIPILDASGKLPATIGAVGPKGDAGTQASAGFSGYEQLQPKQVVISNDTSRDQTITCPGGKSVLGGGYNIPQDTQGGTGVKVTESRPDSNSVWKFRIDLGTSNPKTVWLYAICANVTS
jgi:hypothetical protein